MTGNSLRATLRGLLLAALLTAPCSASETFCSSWFGPSDAKKPCEAQIEALRQRRQTCLKLNELNTKLFHLNQTDWKARLSKRHIKLVKRRSKWEARVAALGVGSRREVRRLRAKRRLERAVLEEERKGKVESLESLLSLKEAFKRHRTCSLESQDLQQAIDKLTRLVGGREADEQRLGEMGLGELAGHLESVKGAWKQVSRLAATLDSLVKSVAGAKLDAQRPAQVRALLAEVEAMEGEW